MNIRLKVGGVELIELHKEPMSEDSKDTLIGVVFILTMAVLFIVWMAFMAGGR